MVALLDSDVILPPFRIELSTPGLLTKAIVEVMRPAADATICDPACGTGGFFLAAAEYIMRHNPTMEMDERKRLRDEALRGCEIVDATARICAMNLLLHGIGRADGDSLIRVDDSLRAVVSWQCVR